MFGISPINQWVLDNFRLEKTDSNFILDLTRFITHLGDGLTLILIGLCVLAFLIFKKSYKLSLVWSVAVALSFGLSSGLKHIFGKARPDEAYHLIHAVSPAFPSGHALRSTVVYILGALLILSILKISKGRITILLITACLPILIGLSRLLLGVHWFADVLAGWSIGLAICGFFYAYSFKWTKGWN